MAIKGQELGLIEPRRAFNIRLMEMEMPKKILAEVFHAQLADVEASKVCE